MYPYCIFISIHILFQFIETVQTVVMCYDSILRTEVDPITVDFER